MTPKPRIEAAFLYRERRRLVQLLLAQHALSVVDAMPFTPSAEREQRVFARMLQLGIVREPRKGWYYVDLRAYDEDVDVRRRQGVTMAVVASVGIAAFAILFYMGST